mmetsp:Transcript_1366/g.2725  ORF Transcript_1366/g.2725 Transcript_1366/m.2725 type:complete len:212 (+) Transcript_1366:687-1322(+)
MVGEGEGHVGQPVEGQFAIGARVVDLRMLRRFLGRRCIGLAVFHRAKQAETKRIGPHVEAAEGQRGAKPVLRPHRLNVAHFLEVLPDCSGPDFLLIVVQLVRSAPRSYGGISRLCRSLAREHCVMIALDARHVDHSDRATEQRHARCHHLAQRLVAALGDRPRAICDAFAALQKGGDHRVMLEALELHVGEDVRVLVAEMDHEADVNLIVL